MQEQADAVQQPTVIKEPMLWLVAKVWQTGKIELARAFTSEAIARQFAGQVVGGEGYTVALLTMPFQTDSSEDSRQGQETFTHAVQALKEGTV